MPVWPPTSSRPAVDEAVSAVAEAFEAAGAVVAVVVVRRDFDLNPSRRLRRWAPASCLSVVGAACAAVEEAFEAAVAVAAARWAFDLNRLYLHRTAHCRHLLSTSCLRTCAPTSWRPVREAARSAVVVDSEALEEVVEVVAARCDLHLD